MSLNPVINLLPNSQFNPSGDLSEWTAPAGPTLGGSAWTSSTLLPANGSGGNIPFPAFSGYTPVSYTAPATNAPPGNAAFTGFRPSRVGVIEYSSVTLNAGYTYTLSFWYAGNSGQAGLTWAVQAEVDAVEGSFGAPGSYWTWQTFSPSAGWQQYTLTFVSNISQTATFIIRGIGTDGTLVAGSNIIGGSPTVAGPVLIADVTLTCQSGGMRAYPGVPVGTTQGTLAAGNDARFPHLDANRLIVPRVERVDMVLQGTLSGGLTAPGSAATPPTNGLIYATYVMASVASITPPDTVSADVLVGGASILGGNLLVISSAGVSLVSVSRPLNVTVTSGAPITIANPSSSGSSGTTLSVSLWLYIPVP